MKRLRYRKRQRKERKSPHKILRLVLERLGSDWDQCMIAYQDPNFINDAKKPPTSPRHFWTIKAYVASITRPEFINSTANVSIYLKGSSSQTQFLTIHGSINKDLLGFWKALDLWARNYNWPTEIPKASRFWTSHNNSAQIDNTKVQEPSLLSLQQALFMSFYSLW